MNPSEIPRVNLERRYGDRRVNGMDVLQEEFKQHKEAFAAHLKENEERWEMLVRMQEQNTAAIQQLTHSTQGLVDAWLAANTLQKFIKWASSFAILGGFIAWAAKKFM